MVMNFGFRVTGDWQGCSKGYHDNYSKVYEFRLQVKGRAVKE